MNRNMTSFLLISCVLICGTVYANSNDKSGFDFDTNKKNDLPSKSPKSNFLNYTQEKNQQTKQISDVISPEPTEEKYDDFTKEEIFSRLHSTYKNFETAKGSFEEYNIRDGKMVVDYQLITCDAIMVFFPSTLIIKTLLY